MVRYLYRVMLAMMLLRQLGRGALSLPSHADDDATETTWLWHGH
jgi:hypothetical protein